VLDQGELVPFRRMNVHDTHLLRGEDGQKDWCIHAVKHRSDLVNIDTLRGKTAIDH
jgi:hypothetical protein